MPAIDQKRITGPESSLPYRIYSKLNAITYQEKLEDLINNGLRKDGRDFESARKIFLKAGVLSQAKGSAYIELGDTKVIVAVFDPREIPKQNKYSIHGELFCDFKFSPFACQRRKMPQTDSEEKSLAQAMMRALLPAVCLHEFPNFQVDIFANVLQDGGSSLGAAITCAGLALADAGIPMYDVVTASTVAILGNQFLLDPTLEEENLCYQSEDCEYHGVLMMARLATHEQISETWHSGNLSLKKLIKATNILVESNKDIVLLTKQLLVAKVTKFIKKEINLNVESAMETVDNENDKE